MVCCGYPWRLRCTILSLEARLNVRYSFHQILTVESVRVLTEGKSKAVKVSLVYPEAPHLVMLQVLPNAV